MKLLLLDGNSLTYRAFFALPQDMATASGQLTNAVFGFTSMFINVVKEQRPDSVLVAFDRPEPTFRHHQDPDYKANRESAPDTLRQQMGLVREVLNALGVATCELAGWEADDLIATAAQQAVDRGDDVVIVTGDRDVYQLVSDPGVKVLYNRRGVSDYALYDEAGIFERTGVTPAQYPEYAALRGDPSDNLPGVPGVGEKTAAKLIQKYGGLDGIFEHVAEQTPKLRESLAAHEGRVRMNHDVSVLRRDAPVELPDDLTIRPNADEVKRLFDFLEFRAFADRLADALGPAAPVLSDSERQELVAEVTSASRPRRPWRRCSRRRRCRWPEHGRASRVAPRCTGWRSSPIQLMRRSPGSLPIISTTTPCATPSVRWHSRRTTPRRCCARCWSAGSTQWGSCSTPRSPPT